MKNTNKTLMCIAVSLALGAVSANAQLYQYCNLDSEAYPYVQAAIDGATRAAGGVTA